MDKARSKNGNAHHHQCNWQKWDRSSVIRVEDSIIEFVEKLSLRFGLFDGNTQICLQGDNLMTELTISSNMGKEHFRLDVAKDAIPASHKT